MSSRREFLKASAALSLAGLPSSGESQGKVASLKGSPEHYELRVYRLRSGGKVKLVNDFLKDAALPAMNRAAVRPVGVFTQFAGPDNPAIFVLSPHKSLEDWERARAAVASDAQYQKLGAEYLNASSTDPAFVRMESTLLVAFEGFPKLESPLVGKPRIFELRRYESHSERAGQKKIEMFNTAEIGIFRRTGLQPVFFGEALVGSKLPHLVYMLTFEDMAAHDATWARFQDDPDWKKLRSTPGYGDGEIVSNTSNFFLRPAPYSQI